MTQAGSKTATPPATRNATPHDPSRESQPSAEQAEPAPESFVQRAAGGVGVGGSPHTPPADFGSLLGQMQGSSTRQAGLLRQLQRKYGNSYVGEVIRRRAAGTEAAAVENRSGDSSAGEGGSRPGAAGRPLEASTRAFMESRFGHDFADVKIHSGADAAEAARAIRAQAFTFGHDIYFGEGRFQPDTHTGRELLAHELTHVVQQKDSPAPASVSGLTLSDPGDASEQEADRVAHQVMRGDASRAGHVGPNTSGAPALLARRTHLGHVSHKLIQREGDGQGDKKTDDQKKDSADKTPASAPAQTAVSAAHTDVLTELRNILDKAAKGKPSRLELNRVVAIWRGFGESLPQVAVENTELWDRSVGLVDSVGYLAPLYDIDELDPVREQFKADVKAVALGHLAKNQKLARAELARYRVKEGMTPPTLPPAFANVPGMPEPLPDTQLRRLQRLQSMAAHAFVLQEMLERLKKIPVGLMGESFNPARPPVGDFRIGELTSWEMIKLEWDNVSSMLGLIVNNNPTIYVALNLGKDYLKSIVETDPKKDRLMALHTVRLLMSAILDNISNARANIVSERADPRDFKPIHAQLYAGQGNKLWTRPFYKAVAKHEVKDHQDTEYWIKLGLDAAGFVALVAVELASMGAATFLITAALGAAKMYMAEESHGAIAAAGQSQVTGGTDIVYKEQVQAARIEAESQRINLVASLVLLGAGKAAGPAVSKLLAPVGTFGAPVEAAAATLGGRLRMSVLSGIVTGMPTGMLSTGAMLLPQVIRGEMSADAFLQKVGWGGVTNAFTSAIQGALTAAGQHAIQGGFAKPSADLTKGTADDLSKPPSTELSKAPPERVDFDKLPSPRRPPTPKALPGDGDAPRLPGGGVWESTPAQFNAESGEVVQMFKHLPTGEIFTIRFNFETGNGSITGLGQTVAITGSVLQRPPAGLLPPAAPGETPAAQPPSQTPGAPVHLLPQPSPGTPGAQASPAYPSFPGRPAYPALPGSPAPATPPGPQVYPRLPGRPFYPLLPVAPGAAAPPRAPGEPLVTPTPHEPPLLPRGPVPVVEPPPESMLIHPEDALDPDVWPPPGTVWEPPPPPVVTPEQQAVFDAKTEKDYLAALRNEPQPVGSVGRAWDYARFPKAPRGRGGQWKPGDPIDMPDAKGDYPTYDTARGRYWKNRAYYELQGRAGGRAAHDPADLSDPIRVLSDAELQGLMKTGKAPMHPVSKKPMELEHQGVPQRVVSYLVELGFSPNEARRLTRVSSPESLLEVDPLEHAFFDAEAAGFGKQRADVTGKQWSGTDAADERVADPLSRMDDATLLDIAERSVGNKYNFNKNDKTRDLRDALLAEIEKRGLPYPMPAGNPPVQRSRGEGRVGEAPRSNTKLEKPARSNPSTDDGGQQLSQQIGQAAAGGQKLDDAVRQRLEAGLGADLTRVRIHTDARAARLAQTIDAAAFTAGHDIYFSDGAYQTETQAGLRLLAHEAAHTVQQSQGPVAGTPAPGGVRLSDPSDADEQSADRAADLAVASPHDADRGNAAHINHPAPLGQPRAREGSHGLKASASVQRYKGAGGAPPTGEPEQASTDKDVGPTISYGDYVLSKDKGALYEVLAAEAKKNGYQGALSFANDFYLYWHRSQTPPPSKAENDLAFDIGLLLQGQVESLNNYRFQLFNAFEVSAKSFTLALLEESRKIIEEQAKKLGLKPAMEDEFGVCFTDEHTDNYGEKITNEEEGAGLAAAAGEMFPQRRQIEALSMSIIGSGPLTERHSGISKPEPGEIEELKKTQQELAEAQFKYNMTRAKWEPKYPILAAYGEDSVKLEAISRGVGSAAETVVPLINQKLRNIKTVREGVDKLIWKEEKILKGAEGDLGVAKDSLDDKLIRERASNIALDATLDNAAKGLLAIMLGLVAAVPTGGASLAASVAATAAAIGGASLSVYQTLKAVEQYELESAAAGTDFDKAKAISQDDPSLFWLALDIVAVVVDIRGALSAFKSLAGAVRSAIAVRTMMREAEEAMKLAGYARELEAIQALTAKNRQLYERILLHIGEAADAGKLPLKELEDAARAQYNALKESGRLAEIGDIPEELFVKQMTSGARGHIIVSGAEGVKRTQIITSLLDPNSTVLKGILRGDGVAMDALLVQHGNWKQLISMLDQGTPEMRKAAAKLLGRRAEIELEVEFFFNAKLSGKASAEAISDVDRATSGLDAGKLMIEAEEYVASAYGKGWSEALRMNFYTEAARLTQYEKVMGRLGRAQRAALLTKLTEETEVYNLARMLEHAHGNEELLRDAKAYADRLKISVDDPRIAELLPQLQKGVTTAERNKLLLEVDDLMRRYVNAMPGSEEQLKLAEEITRKQMRANLFTHEAYIGPGATRMVVGRHMVVGHEAYQAALSNIDMIFGALAENGGDIVLTMRQYEVYKYMSRFAEAAELAGVKHPMLQNWKAISKTVYKTERQAMEEVSYLRPGKPGTIIDPDITGVEAKQLYESWRSFSQQVLDEMKKIADAAPPDWSPPPGVYGAME